MLTPYIAAAFALLAIASGCNRSSPAEVSSARPVAPAAAPTSVTMTKEAIAAAGVTTTKVTASTLALSDELPGTIEAPRDALVIVNTRAAGVVDVLDFDVGDKVNAGQRVAIVRSVELAEAEAAYRRALVAHKYAVTALERTRALRAEGVVPQKRLDADELEVNERKLALEEAAAKVKILGGALGGEDGVLVIASPITGTIATRSANRGQALEANKPLYTIVDVSQVVVQLRAPGGTPVEPGAKVPFTVDSLPGRSFTAVVKSSSDLLDPDTRRFLIRCSVDNADAALKPGMFVTARLPRATVTAITVPQDAIQVMPEGPSVFIAEPGGKFTRRLVSLGAKTSGLVCVEKGLSEGEEIVVQGAFWVRTQLQKSELED